MTSVIRIINNSFINLGKPPVIDAGSPDTNPQFSAAVDIYDELLEAILTQYPWRFAMKTFELNILVEPPPVDRWTKQAQIPADLLLIYRTEPIINYEVFRDKIYLLDVEDVKLDYIFRPLESEFPPYFSDAMILQLTSRIAMNVTQQPSVAEFWGVKAERILTIAKHLDSTIQPQPTPIRDALVSAHYGSSGLARGRGRA